MSDEPSAACRLVQKALVKRVSRSETSTSGRPTSWKTEETKLRAGQEVDMHLQKVMTGAGDRQFQKIEADAPAPARGHGEGEQQACWRQMVGFDALARRAGPHRDVLLDCSRQARPPPSENSCIGKCCKNDL